MFGTNPASAGPALELEVTVRVSQNVDGSMEYAGAARFVCSELEPEPVLMPGLGLEHQQAQVLLFAIICLKSNYMLLLLLFAII